MEVIDKIVEPIEYRTTLPNFFKYENFYFYLLIIGILVHGITLIFITFDDLTCRSQEPGIVEQFDIGQKEIRDLNNYIDTICSTDIKTRHFGVFIIQIIFICFYILYAFFLKGILQTLEIKYNLYYKLEITEDIILKSTDINQDDLKSDIKYCFGCYVCTKYVILSILVLFIAVLFGIKYGVAETRDLFLPYENECGPTLWWGHEGDDDDIGEYYCHYKAEWTVFTLMILVDVFNLVLFLCIFAQLFIFCVTLCYFGKCWEGKCLENFEKDSNLLNLDLKENDYAINSIHHKEELLLIEKERENSIL